MTEDNETTFKPVYVSWQMIINVAERMRTEGIPARVDRSYLGTASGTTKAQFLAAAKALNFLDSDLKPTEIFTTFVTQPDARPNIARQMLSIHYAPVIKLGTNATQQQLEEVFREQFGISGSTVRKAITFYLAAAKFANIEVSPHFTMPRPSGTAGTTRRRRTAKQTTPRDSQPATITDPMAELRTKYVTTLLDKFAAANGEVDAELADRIERLIGFGAASEES